VLNATPAQIAILRAADLVLGRWGELLAGVDDGATATSPSTVGSPVATSPAASTPSLNASRLAASQGALSRLENVWPYLLAPVMLLLAIVTFRRFRRRRI
jgi:hypothetical protein